MSYKYLFPFGQVLSGTRVLIYGAGDVGIDYYKQIQLTKYCDMVGFIDKNASRLNEFVVPVYSPDQIVNLDYDYVVIALLTPGNRDVVKEELLNRGIPQVKIVEGITFEAKEIDIYKNDTVTFTGRYAYQVTPVSIAIKLSGELGGNIIRKRVIEGLAELAPGCAIDLYSTVADTFLPVIYRGCPWINAFISDAGAIYQNHMNRYALALKIRSYFEVDVLHEKMLNENYDRLLKFLNSISEYNTLYTPAQRDAYAWAALGEYTRKNVYTINDIDGSLGIRDNHVKLLINSAYETEFRALGLPRYYITINYGNGYTLGRENIHAKQWPFRYFVQFIEMFKANFPQVDIVQLGAKGAEALPGVKYRLLGQHLDLVEHILLHSVLHLDVEGGLVHLATQLGTKCVVLFGQTQLNFYAFEENINIQAGSCQGCYGICNSPIRCVRNLVEPDCMKSITPEIVMKYVADYISSLYIVQGGG